MGVILKAENISKQYRLGLVGTGTLSHDLNRAWARLRGKEDPYLKVGAVNDRATKAESKYVWALKDINFEVQQGEILGIIGKNGAGKSTLLKLLSRVTSPTTGVIKTKGRIASLLEVGTGFHPELTGKENVFLNGAILGMRKAEIAAKLEEIVQFSGCEKYIDTPVKRYSSGMRVRLAFAVAAHLEPDILVVDEVLAVGDAEFQKKAIGKMQDISRGEGRTVLFVSHNMASIQSLCKRLMIIENGTITYRGDVEKGIAYYTNLSKATSNKLDSNKKFGITNISCLNTKNEQIKTILVGQKVKFKVRYKNPKQTQLSIALAFYDNFDSFLFGCRSDVIESLYSDLEGEAFLIIEKWPLSPGIYTVNTSIHEKGITLENLKDVFTFEVIKGDFYGFGKLPASSKKGFYIDYLWD